MASNDQNSSRDVNNNVSNGITTTFHGNRHNNNDKFYNIDDTKSNSNGHGHGHGHVCTVTQNPQLCTLELLEQLVPETSWDCDCYAFCVDTSSTTTSSSSSSGFVAGSSSESKTKWAGCQSPQGGLLSEHDCSRFDDSSSTTTKLVPVGGCYYGLALENSQASTTTTTTTATTVTTGSSTSSTSSSLGGVDGASSTSSTKTSTSTTSTTSVSALIASIVAVMIVGTIVMTLVLSRKLLKMRNRRKRQTVVAATMAVEGQYEDGDYDGDEGTPPHPPSAIPPTDAFFTTNDLELQQQQQQQYSDSPEDYEDVDVDDDVGNEHVDGDYDGQPRIV